MHTRPDNWLGWARLYLHVFRVVVVTTCFVLATYAWLAHIPWLIAAGACIGTGELLECTYYLTVLGWGTRTFRLSGGS